MLRGAWDFMLGLAVAARAHHRASRAGAADSRIFDKQLLKPTLEFVDGWEAGWLRGGEWG